MCYPCVSFYLSSFGALVGQRRTEQRPKVTKPRLGPHPLGRRPRQSGTQLHHHQQLPSLRLGSTGGSNPVHRKHLDRGRRSLRSLQRESVWTSHSSEKTAAAQAFASCSFASHLQTASSSTSDLRNCKTVACH